MQKNILAISDISCVGRCSLTVALPVLSAAGACCSILPTAVLSTHTGGFSGYTFRDLTDDLAPILAHWGSLGLRFDAVYSGYLGSARQVETVARAMRDFAAPGAARIVDPVMGDGGAFYAGFSAEFAGEMRALCREADVITPNLTEAALLLDRPYAPGPHTEAELFSLCDALREECGAAVVLTGAQPDDASIGAAVLDRDGAFSLCLSPRLPFSMPGTGDVFASCLTAALLAGAPLPAAAQTAADFTRRAMARSAREGRDKRYGPCFEPELPWLAARLAEL